MFVLSLITFFLRCNLKFHRISCGPPVASENNLKEKKKAALKPREESIPWDDCVAVMLKHRLFHFSLVKLFTASLHNGLGVKVCIYASLFASSVAINHVAWEEEVLEYFNVFTVFCAQSHLVGGR